MSGRNVPNGWAAFRALRQTPARHRPKRHGNWQHGGRSRFGIDEGRKLRLMLRLIAAPGAGLGLAAPSFLEWLAPPRPVGWGGFRNRRSDPVE